MPVFGRARRVHVKNHQSAKECPTFVKDSPRSEREESCHYHYVEVMKAGRPRRRNMGDARFVRPGAKTERTSRSSNSHERSGCA